MKLVAEQIKYLRERREELIQRKAEFSNYLSNHREKEAIEGTGGPLYIDFQESNEYRRCLMELDEIDQILSSSEVVIERDFGKIEIGTAFFAKFNGDDERERFILVDRGVNASRNYCLISVESDFGKAVEGSKEGDMIVYTVAATGRQIGVKIEQIDRMEEHYYHFIREKELSCRIAKRVSRWLGYMKKVNPGLYEKNHELSYSQKQIALEELQGSSNLSSSRKAFLKRKIAEPCAKLPKDGSIGVGSKVVITLTNEKGNTRQLDFEFINRAISSELECHYVEKITPLGIELFGLKAGDTFCVTQKHKPRLYGVVDSVDNDYINQIERVR